MVYFMIFAGRKIIFYQKYLAIPSFFYYFAPEI